MTALLVLSRDAKSFIYKCPHCSHERSELVDPALNPYPFNFITHCSACGKTIRINHQFIRNVQASFQRAINPATTARAVPITNGAKAPIVGVKKMPDVSGEENAGREGGGDIKITGSPAYSACKTIRADADSVAGAGLEPATSWL